MTLPGCWFLPFAVLCVAVPAAFAVAPGAGEWVIDAEANGRQVPGPEDRGREQVHLSRSAVAGPRLARLEWAVSVIVALLLAVLPGRLYAAVSDDGGSYQGLWWAAPAGAESGWGISLAHQGDTIFAIWSTYDTEGAGWWLSMAAQRTAEGTYAGQLIETHGPAFSATPIGGRDKMLVWNDLEADEKIKVKKASGANGYTVAEIHQQKAKLNKKKVTVRGKVVKVSSGIMNRNWIHLQDGTGNHATMDNDLVLTSDAIPSVGDGVVVKGTVVKDKDFGSGYKHSVIIEQAEIVIE